MALILKSDKTATSSLFHVSGKTDVPSLAYFDFVTKNYLFEGLDVNWKNYFKHTRKGPRYNIVGGDTIVEVAEDEPLLSFNPLNKSGLYIDTGTENLLGHGIKNQTQTIQKPGWAGRAMSLQVFGEGSATVVGDVQIITTNKEARYGKPIIFSLLDTTLNAFSVIPAGNVLHMQVVNMMFDTHLNPILNGFTRDASRPEWIPNVKATDLLVEKVRQGKEFTLTVQLELLEIEKRRPEYTVGLFEFDLGGKRFFTFLGNKGQIGSGSREVANSGGLSYISDVFVPDPTDVKVAINFSNGVLSGYINGIRYWQKEFPNINNLSTFDKLIIGSATSLTSAYSRSTLIKNVAIYTDKLSEEQLRAISTKPVW